MASQKKDILMPCKLGDKDCMCSDNNLKPFCKNWIPCSRSKYARCALFLTARITCDRKADACPTCEHYFKQDGFEWTFDHSDPEAIKKHHRQKARRRRAKAKELKNFLA